MNSALTRVFVWMFIGLLCTAISALAVVRIPTLQDLVMNNSAVMIVLIVLELGLVIGISAAINKLSSPAAIALFLLYAVVNGLTLSFVFWAYELPTVFTAFSVTAATFGAMAIIGAVTKRDLTKIGGLCMMGLIGIMIASIVNIFIGNGPLDTLLCIVGVLIFVGLTAYDTQRIKRQLAQAGGDTGDEFVKKISVMGALSLYLNFINLFLRILRLLGRRER